MRSLGLLGALLCHGCFLVDYGLQKSDASADAGDAAVAGDGAQPDLDAHHEASSDAAAGDTDAGGWESVLDDSGLQTPEDAAAEAAVPAADAGDAGAPDAAVDAGNPYECIGQASCAPSCPSGATCTLVCESAGTCAPSCAANSRCLIECTDTAHCNATCHVGARCTLACDNSDCLDSPCPPGAQCNIRSCTNGALCPYS